MFTWHVWGDFALTQPDRIGGASVANGRERDARQTADEHGFNFERRMRNGFEPWAATYESDNDDGQEFAFADCPTVRGWRKL